LSTAVIISLLEHRFPYIFLVSHLLPKGLRKKSVEISGAVFLQIEFHFQEMFQRHPVTA